MNKRIATFTLAAGLVALPLSGMARAQGLTEGLMNLIRSLSGGDHSLPTTSGGDHSLPTTTGLNDHAELKH